jgi:prephenate dehydrogenase
MIVSIIGIGLIGGSMALNLKKKGFATHCIGVDNNPIHQQQALELGLVDTLETLENAVGKSNLIIVATPVNTISELLPKVLDLVDNQVVIEVGSTKTKILEAVALHPKRSRLVASHPMWGTEYNGPQAAVIDAFAGRACVLCERELSDKDAIDICQTMYNLLEMRLLYMNAQDHDLHVAYISHISHITSFALANTVLEKEKEDDKIFALASGGFESTVRLAKSSPQMWTPIFYQNRQNVLEVLNEHIHQLQQFKASLENEDMLKLQKLMENANQIRRIIK